MGEQEKNVSGVLDKDWTVAIYLMLWENGCPKGWDIRYVVYKP